MPTAFVTHCCVCTHHPTCRCSYSYPLLPNHVPAWAVPCVAVFTPVLLVVAARLAGRISRAEAHHAILLAVYCVATTVRALAGCERQGGPRGIQAARW